MKNKSFLYSPVLLFVIGFFSLIMITCSASPRQWEELVTVEVVGETLILFNMEAQGHPPYYWEIFDNPKFEGSPRFTGSSAGNSFSVTSLGYGKASYFRIRSRFGEWQVYGPDPGHPTPLIFYNYSNDRGLSDNPHLINNRADLIAFRDRDLTRYPLPVYSMSLPNFESMNFILTTDIDLTGVTWKPLGNNTLPFMGSFDGGGHIISGFESLDTSQSEGYAGFFGLLGAGSSVKNLGIKITNLTCSENDTAFGGLAGSGPGTGSTSASIESCYVSGGKITGKTNTQNTGGFLGTGIVTVNNCYTDITVEGKGNTGGFIGTTILASATAITNCYSAGNVIYSGTSPTAYLGGFIGYNNNTTPSVTDCISLNKKVLNISGVSDYHYIFGGGINGSTHYSKIVYSPGATTRTYWGPPAFSEPVNPYTMHQNTAPFNNWNFSGIWRWEPSLNRPVLIKVKQ